MTAFKKSNLFGLDLLEPDSESDPDMYWYEQVYFSYQRGVTCGRMGMSGYLNPYFRPAQKCVTCGSMVNFLFRSWHSGWLAGRKDWIKASRDLDRKIGKRQ